MLPAVAAVVAPLADRGWAVGGRCRDQAHEGRCAKRTRDGSLFHCWKCLANHSAAANAAASPALPVIACVAPAMEVTPVGPASRLEPATALVSLFTAASLSATTKRMAVVLGI